MNNDDCPSCKRSAARLTEAAMNMAILQLKADALEREVASIKEYIKKHHGKQL
jgi:predicted ATP-grasp superfamily ATP-dependent carboligase